MLVLAVGMFAKLQILIPMPVFVWLTVKSVIFGWHLII